jgi:signal transduction histidine kinase
LLQEEVRQMQPLARERQLELATDLPRPPLWLHCDRIKLSRILGNLVGNAIKFTDKGQIRVEAALNESGTIQIRVADTGVGIAAESMVHIFDEFFQLRNPERDRNKGTGLGLTICKRLIDAMGGQIDVKSTPGEGSTFTVTLPPTAVLHTRQD